MVALEMASPGGGGGQTLARASGALANVMQLLMPWAAALSASLEVVLPTVVSTGSDNTVAARGDVAARRRHMVGFAIACAAGATLPFLIAASACTGPLADAYIAPGKAANAQVCPQSLDFSLDIAWAPHLCSCCSETQPLFLAAFPHNALARPGVVMLGELSDA